jgi:hypothetical protein
VDGDASRSSRVEVVVVVVVVHDVEQHSRREKVQAYTVTAMQIT